MRIHLCVVGRLRAGPERDLVDDYLKRFERTGRALGLGPVRVQEVDDRKGGGMSAEADLLRRALPSGARLCVLDERGTLMTSPDFSAPGYGGGSMSFDSGGFIFGSATSKGFSCPLGRGGGSGVLSSL